LLGSGIFVGSLLGWRVDIEEGIFVGSLLGWRVGNPAGGELPLDEGLLLAFLVGV
jgi:hypothetical protein